MLNIGDTSANDGINGTRGLFFHTHIKEELKDWLAVRDQMMGSIDGNENLVRGDLKSVFKRLKMYDAITFRWDCSMVPT